MKKHLNLLWLLLPILIITSCKNNPYKDQVHDNPSDQAQIDQNAIIDYLVKNGINNAQRTEDGLYYTIETEGTGENPTAASEVEIHYRGTRLDGHQFDSSYDRGQPYQTSLSRVVPGWTKGVPLFKEGGKGKLFIPSGLAYGAKAAGKDIPANTPLVFEIELLNVVTEEEKAAQILERQAQVVAAGKAKHGEADEKAIKAYIAKNKLKAERTESGIYYIIEEAGGAEKPVAHNKVTIHYKGTTFDGEKFDASYDRNEPITYPLYGFIPGWTQGISLFGKGGKGTLLIPSHMAYGERGSGENIPANACLRFDIELFDFK